VTRDDLVLERELLLTRAELAASARQLRNDVLCAVDAPARVRAHPLGALGIGSAAGFVLGGGLARSRRARRRGGRWLGAGARGALRAAVSLLF
jgi:hypothetical protein